MDQRRLACSGTSSTSSGCSSSRRSGCCNEPVAATPPAHAGSVRGDRRQPVRSPCSPCSAPARGTAVSDADSAGDLGAQLYGDHCASCHGVDGAGRRGPRPDRSLDEGRAAVDFVLRTGRMPIADPDMAGAPRPGALQRGGDRAPSSTTPARSATGPTSPTSTSPRGDLAAGGETLPPQLRRLPRGLRLGRRDRRRAGGAVADGVRHRRRSARRSSSAPARCRCSARSTPRTSTTSPRTSTTCSAGTPPASTTSVASARSPRDSPPGCSACCRSSPSPAGSAGRTRAATARRRGRRRIRPR